MGHHISQFASDGALALHLGSSPDERRARTAAAREASIISRRNRARRSKPTMADRIAAAEAALPSLDPDERARQQRWIDQAKENLNRRDDDQLVAS